jgi:hypothetical protein
MTGAALQLVYGVLAVVWPYPLIIAPAPELVWGVVNLGILAGIAAWLAIDVARPRWLALIGGGVAILGHLMRVAVSIWTSIQPGANPDSVTATILASIALMFGGMALLAIGTVVGRRLFRTGPLGTRFGSRDGPYHGSLLLHREDGALRPARSSVGRGMPTSGVCGAP